MAKEKTLPEVKVETHREINEPFHFAQSVRMLWQAMGQVAYGGIDTDDLASLCSILVRIADQRLLRLQSGAGGDESDKAIAIEQLRECREAALKVLEAAKAPPAEPDWSAVAATLATVGAAPLEYLK